MYSLGRSLAEVLERERVREAMASAGGARMEDDDEEEDVRARRGCVIICAYVGTCEFTLC